MTAEHGVELKIEGNPKNTLERERGGI